MNPPDRQAGHQNAPPGGGLLPLAAASVSILAAFSLFVLVFFFSDPSGEDIGAFTYGALAVLLGLAGVGGWRLGRKALREGRPHRYFSIAASWIGIATASGAVAFLFFGFVANHLFGRLIFG